MVSYFRWLLIALVATCCAIEKANGLQIGPFSIPSIDDGVNFFRNAASNAARNAVSALSQLSNVISRPFRREEPKIPVAIETTTKPPKMEENGDSAVTSSVKLNLSSTHVESHPEALDGVISTVPFNPPSTSPEPITRNRGSPINRHDPHFYPGRHVMVHLFEWKFEDIATECERVLGPGGFGGVQVSPINEYAIAPNRPWWERYQPISYKVNSRSGNEEQFTAMVRRCQRAGVRIYVDVVVNHMAAVGGYGTAGSRSDPANKAYPGVPYNRSHFHADCTIRNYQNATEVRDCALNGLPDLNQTEPFVQERIVDFMNRLIGFGVAGFRMDASKHIWPDDLEAIYNRLLPLNSAFEFPMFADPYIYQEVIDLGNEPITAAQYIELGSVTEFKYSFFIGLLFRGELEATALQALIAERASQFGLVPSQSALVFVDNHDNQRGHGAGGAFILTFKDGSKYAQAVAFMLATDYGVVRLMSSYNFTDSDQGPPADESQVILSPGLPNVNDHATCENGWICEHRWPVVRRMVHFRNFVAPSPITDVQMTSGTFAFCRGNIGFAVFNIGAGSHDGIFNTCLPPGEYCDLITGDRVDTKCTATRVLVNGDGTVSLTLPSSSGVVLDLLNRVT